VQYTVVLCSFSIDGATTKFPGYVEFVQDLVEYGATFWYLYWLSDKECRLIFAQTILHFASRLDTAIDPVDLDLRTRVFRVGTTKAITSVAYAEKVITSGQERNRHMPAISVGKRPAEED
jgi:hypothetical protein